MKKFIEKPLDWRSNPQALYCTELCRMLNTVANSFLMTQDYSAEEEMALKFKFASPKEATTLLLHGIIP